jgi:hypothetical protein
MLVALMQLAGAGLMDQMLVRDSLSRVHPRMRASWLKERGLDDSYYTTFHRPESTGLSCVGRWPWGPSWELAGRDTFMYLGSGSGVRILSIADSVHPRMLGQINARGLVSQVVVQDSLIFVACGSLGAQIYSVSDPANPRELGSMDAVIGDLTVKDSLCYTAGGDSFRIYSVADPSSPKQLGAHSDTGALVVVVGLHAFVADGSGMNVYDVSTPSSPVRVNSRGGSYATLFVRDTLLFSSDVQPSYFAILDVGDPLNIRQVGNLSGYGGHGLYVNDYFAYLSCTYDHQGIFVIDITNPANPQLRDSLNPDGTENWDPYVPVPLSYGYLASDYGGLVTLDLHNVNSISEAWSGYEACRSLDIYVDGERAYVADDEAGLQIVDVTDPTNPSSLGRYDLAGARTTTTVQVRDSFAFIGFWGSNRRFLRVLDVTDPASPTFAAEESCRNPLQDMVLRDTLLYCAEMNEFQIFNVARPREPKLAGSCNISGTGVDMLLQDTLAYVSSLPTQIVNVVNPASPNIIGTFPTYGNGLAVRDSIAFAPALYDSMVIYNVRNPSSPVRIGRYTFSGGHVWNAGVALVGTTLYVGGDLLHVLDVSDPLNPTEITAWRPPYDTRRLVYDTRYLYAACYEAGVAILETIPTGIEENAEKGGVVGRFSVSPSITLGPVLIRADAKDGQAALRLYDAAGVSMDGRQARVRRGETGLCWSLDMSRFPDGVYFVRMFGADRSFTTKVVKTKRR